MTRLLCLIASSGETSTVAAITPDFDVEAWASEPDRAKALGSLQVRAAAVYVPTWRRLRGTE